MLVISGTFEVFHKKNHTFKLSITSKISILFEKNDLNVQARGHRRQQLTIIKILIYLDETNKYINLGMMISLKK